MPLPLILGIGAAVAGVAGVGTGVHGAVKMKDAQSTMERAERVHENNMSKFKSHTEMANKSMDDLGKLELEILKSFSEFQDTIEKIQNRPQFKEYNNSGIELPKYEGEKIKEVSVGAGVLLGGLSGAAAGTAGAFAASGATTAAVMALGTASTGTAIASLSGAAATNATLAALGGGAIAAGGGGIALGTTILGAATLGVGLLVGGAIFSVTGGKLSDKADDAMREVRREERKIEEICVYLKDLDSTAGDFKNALSKVKSRFDEEFAYVSYMINKLNNIDWNNYSESECTAVQNCILLVQLLYKMCKVQIVEKPTNNEDVNSIRKDDVDKAVYEANKFLREVA